VEELLLLSKEQLVEIILRLETRIAKLEMRLGIDSTTSSKPPSTDLLTKSEHPQSSSPEEPPKRKPGGQLGHKGFTRKGFAKPDHFALLRPEQCAHCGRRM
jgi:transposase